MFHQIFHDYYLEAFHIHLVYDFTIIENDLITILLDTTRLLDTLLQID